MFYAQAAWIRALWHSRARRRSLFSALAAQIRLGHFFFMFVCTGDAYILCAGCGDPGLVSFWLLPGTVPGISGAFCICAGCVDPLVAFFLYECIYIWGFYFVRRLRGSVPTAFWLLPGDARRPLGVVVVVFSKQTPAICVRKNLIVTPAREPLQAKGSLGLVWAHLGSPGRS